VEGWGGGRMKRDASWLSVYAGMTNTSVYTRDQSPPTCV
jgi:hypothetical protein